MKRLMVVGLLLLGLWVLPFHGPASAVHAGSVAVSTFPCQSLSLPSQVTVARTNSFINNPIHNASPFHRLIRNPHRVHALFHAMCGLHRAQGVYHCPNDFGVAYHLAFKDTHALIIAVTLRASGCTFLSVDRRPSAGSYWIWFDPATRPVLPWMRPGYRFAVALARALTMPLDTLTPRPAPASR